MVRWENTRSLSGAEGETKKSLEPVPESTMGSPAPAGLYTWPHTGRLSAAGLQRTRFMVVVINQTQHLRRSMLHLYSLIEPNLRIYASANQHISQSTHQQISILPHRPLLLVVLVFFVSPSPPRPVSPSFLKWKLPLLQGTLCFLRLGFLGSQMD